MDAEPGVGDNLVFQSSETTSPAPAGPENAPAPEPEVDAEPGDGDNLVFESFETTSPVPMGPENAPAPDPEVDPFMRNNEETAAAAESILGGEKEDLNKVCIVNVPRYEVGTSADVLAMFKSKQ